jgi:hypothetical protein
MPITSRKWWSGNTLSGKGFQDARARNIERKTSLRMYIERSAAKSNVNHDSFFWKDSCFLEADNASGKVNYRKYRDKG